MMIQSVTKAGKKLFVILILETFSFKADAIIQQRRLSRKQKKRMGLRNRKKLSPEIGKKPGQLPMESILKL